MIHQRLIVHLRSEAGKCLYSSVTSVSLVMVGDKSLVKETSSRILNVN